MARPKKNGTYLNVYIETSLYEELTSYCHTSGQSKTTAVERSLTEYLEDYKRKQALLESINDNLIKKD